MPQRIGEVIANLAGGGYVDQALEIAKAWLALKDQRIGEATEHESLVPSRPRGILEDWDYREILRLRMPDLVRAGGMAVLRLLCDLLAESVKMYRNGDTQDATDQRIREDYSWIWRPYIASSPRIGNEDIQESLVSAVRDAALLIVGQDVNMIVGVVETLEAYAWTVFWRLSFHVLREVSPIGSDLVCERWSRLSEQRCPV